MILNTFWLWAAFVASVVTWGVHTFVGGAVIVPPLLAAKLSEREKYILYFVWHIVTIVLMAMALGFLFAALYPTAWVLAVQATILALLIGLLNISIAIWRRLGLKELPQWPLFLIVTALGGAAIWL